MVMGDFLELERALQGHRVAQLAADEEEGLPVGVCLGCLTNLGPVVEDRLYGAEQRTESRTPVAGRQRPTMLSDGDGEERQRRELRDERLGGVDTNLRASPDEEALADLVDDCRRCWSPRLSVSRPLCVAQCRERVGRLFELGDPEHDYGVVSYLGSPTPLCRVF
ncbi:hypothetical protein [Haloarcula laminariae]|uniref:hypothetical protein n=1 Tax=Haloarcula laminariae TaxID=2961577 RepID=UPI002404CEB9|nr:hypothetical protein [Halomicroarcula sp. FL173]